MSPCVPCELQRCAGSGMTRGFEAIGHTRLARTHRLWGESRRLGLRAFAELVVVLWGQRTIGSRGDFRERLRVVCGIKCLPAAMGITPLTRGGQNARGYRLEVRVYVLLGYFSCRRRVGSFQSCASDGLVRSKGVGDLHRTHQPISRECTDCSDRPSGPKGLLAPFRTGGAFRSP